MSVGPKLPVNFRPYFLAPVRRSQKHAEQIERPAFIILGVAMNLSSKTDESPEAAIGHLVAQLRRNAGLTQEEAAEKAEMSVRALRNIELGLVSRPRRRTIAALSAALRIGQGEIQELEDLIRRSGPHSDSKAEMRYPWPRSPSFSTLPSAPRHHVGRSSAVELLERQLAPTNTDAGRAILITGAAGMGKTTLAVHIAHRVAEHFPDGVLFLRLRADVDACTVLARTLRMLGVTGSDAPMNLDEQIELYRSLLARHRILVVADNPTAQQARALIPGPSKSALIATCRSALNSLDDFERVSLSPLAAEEGVELLARLLGTDRVGREIADAQRIVSFCGGLPLAIRIAGGRLMANPYRPLSWLADRLGVGHRRLDELTVDDVGVRASLASACADLSPPARSLVSRLGCLRNMHVSAWLAAAAMDIPAHDAETLLDELAAAHLVEPVSTPSQLQQRFIVHDLIHVFAGELGRRTETAASSADAQRRILGAALRRTEEARRLANRYFILRETPPVPRWGPSARDEIAAASPDRWFEWEQNVLVSLTLEACDSGLIDHAYALAEAMFDFQDTLRFDHELHLVHQRIFEAATAAGNEVAQAYAALNRSELNYNRGRQAAMLPDLELARRVLTSRRDRFPMAALSSDLVYLQYKKMQGDLAEALAVARDAVEIAIATNDIRAAAMAHHCLAGCVALAGDAEEALRSFAHALALFEEVDSAIGMSLCCMRLGTTLAALGRREAAHRELIRALALSAEHGITLAEPFILLALTDNAIEGGNVAEARAQLQLCRAALEQHPAENLSARAALLEGKLNELTSDLAGAEQSYRNAQFHAARAGAIILANTIRERMSRLPPLRQPTA